MFLWKNNVMQHRTLILMGLLGVLTSCADTPWPQWITGEPTREQLDAYQGPIPMPNPNSDGKEWPNLADVPKRPVIILPDDKKSLLITEMKDNNMQGLQEIADYNKGIQPNLKPAPKQKTVTKKKKKASAHAK